MYLKKINKTNYPIYKAILFGSFILIGCLLILVTKKTQMINKKTLKSTINDITNIDRINSLKLKELKIRIKNKNFLKIKKIVTDNKDNVMFKVRKYFPAHIEIDGKLVPAKIRLKGDYTSHMNMWKKWSFRIKINGDNTFMQMKVFSIQHPKERYMLNEWIFINQLKKEGILAPKFDFVRVYINGEAWGIYAIEEFFRKELVESQHRREGVIVKFNDDLSFIDGDKSDIIENTGTIAEPFDTKTVFNDTDKSYLFSNAKEKLNGVLNKQFPISKVFDTKLLAKYWALCDLFDALHGLLSFNLRFYYNPITGLLEPIHYDGDVGINDFKGLVGFNNPPIMWGNSDIKFIKLYINELKRISKKEYVLNFHNRIKLVEKRYYDLFDEEFGNIEHYPHFNWKRMYLKASLIRSYIGNLKPELSIDTHESLLVNNNASKRFYIKNLRAIPVEIKRIQIKKGQSWIDSPIISSSLLWNKELMSYPLINSNNYDYFDIKWTRNLDNYNKIKIVYNLLGNSISNSRMINEIRNNNDLFLLNDKQDIKMLVSKHKFLDINHIQKSLLIKSGNWDVIGDLIIPSGYTVYSQDNVKLQFQNDKIFLSFSPLIIKGTFSNSITFTSKGESWGGLLLINIAKESLLKSVYISNVAGIKRSGSIVTGGITFYKSPVKIINSNFSKSYGEDLLNVFHSNINIIDSTFKNSLYDAIDIDFGEGKIHNSIFYNIGNDAIDLSGSNVDLSKLVIEKVGDKGISIGEKSKVFAKYINISEAKYGIVSKDLSKLTLNNSRLSNNKNYALAAYQKKSEYGGGKIEAKNVIFYKNKENYIIDSVSKIILDNKTLESSIYNYEYFDANNK